MLVLILMLAAVLCWVAAAFGLPTRIGLGWAGAALFGIAVIVEHWR